MISPRVYVVLRINISNPTLEMRVWRSKGLFLFFSIILHIFPKNFPPVTYKWKTMMGVYLLSSSDNEGYIYASLSFFPIKDNLVIVLRKVLVNVIVRLFITRRIDGTNFAKEVCPILLNFQLECLDLRSSWPENI